MSPNANLMVQIELIVFAICALAALFHIYDVK